MKDGTNRSPGLDEKPKNLAMILVLYLLGLFMGALDTGIVSPARGVIQNQLGVGETTGIWMITIYTLAYAASIPISGKLADRLGRKVMYIISIFLFGLGSFLCSQAASFGGFSLLLVGRVVQAIGGGGIMPIVTAEIGTTFPPEKRGMALGMVGGIYGIANILGSSAGSFILDIAGNAGWHWLFLINVPISLFIVVGAIFTLDNHRSVEKPGRMDLAGSVLLTGMVLSLMYALTNLSFFDFVNAIAKPSVYPFLIAFVVMIPLFLLVERRAQDPIIPLRYFKDRNLVIAFIVSMLVGTALMGMVFVPQFAENALKMPTGKGGYFVTALGLFAGIGAPLSGGLIDRFGAKKVLLGGFGFTLASGLFLVLYATQSPSLASVLISLFLMGLGMGFTMGTPLNYMVLSAVPAKESNSALSTLSLIRSIGTAISPALMIGFLANAGAGLQTTLMDSLPPPPTKLEIRQVEELKPLLAQIKADPDLASKVPADMLDVDKMMEGNASSFQMNAQSTASGSAMPEDLLKSLQSADVTNIVDRVKALADYMFKTNVTPDVVAAAANGVQQGIDGLNTGLEEMKKARGTLAAKRVETADKKAELEQGIADLDKAVAGVQQGIDGLGEAVSGMDQGLAKQKASLAGMKAALAAMSRMPAGTTAGMPTDAATGMSAGTTAGMPAGMVSGSDAMNPASLEAGIKGLESGIRTLQAKRDAAQAQKAELEKKRTEMTEAQSGMREGVNGLTQALTGMDEGLAKMDASRVLLEQTAAKMAEIHDAIPGAFENARTGYLATLEGMRPELEKMFQEGLDGGFRDMYGMVSVLAAFAMLVLLFYRERKRVAAASGEGMAAPAEAVEDPASDFV